MPGIDLQQNNACRFCVAQKSVPTIFVKKPWTKEKYLLPNHCSLLKLNLNLMGTHSVEMFKCFKISYSSAAMYMSIKKMMNISGKIS